MPYQRPFDAQPHQAARLNGLGLAIEYRAALVMARA